MTVRLILSAGLILLLVSCGGGSDDPPPPPPEPEPNVLFEDTFDEPFPGGRWTQSGPGATVVDVGGEPALSVPDVEVTTTGGPYTRDGKVLQFFVFIAWPAGCPDDGSPGNLTLQILNTDDDSIVASLELSMSADCSTITETYTIHPDGAPSANSVVDSTDWDPNDFGTDFLDYGFVVDSDGVAFWSVEGDLVVETPVVFTPTNLRLRLGGQGQPGMDPVLFDDVVIQRQ